MVALMITDVPGVRCGHWTDSQALTGCTVVLLPPSTVGACEVRGGAPASRELDALGVEMLVDAVHAVVLTGGSAHGLAAADGVMGWCEERGIGFDTGAGIVPIVPALGIFDLANGDGSVRPGSVHGREACEAATDGDVDLGSVGAGTGALIGKWKGPDNVSVGGIVSATVELGPLVVSSVVVVNAFGDVDRGSETGRGQRSGTDEAIGWLRSQLGSGEAEHTAASASTAPVAQSPGDQPTPGTVGTNTTIGLVATNARLDKMGCLMLAQGAHDGLARSIVPTHTRLDGDAFIAVATGEVALNDVGGFVDIDVVRLMALSSVERAIRSL